MWFKQVQLFNLEQNKQFTLEKLIEKLEQLIFRPCLPSMQISSGWVAPVDENDEPLAVLVNGYLVMCMQVEEKILPSTVIQQELLQKIKKIEEDEGRKVRQKEKLALKDELMLTLLPRAFSKLSRYYAYIDIQNNYLILNTTQTKKIDLFLSLFKKTVTENVQIFDLKKLSPIVTSWLKNTAYPKDFSIEKSCLLQDPRDESRVIRCQEQDLFAGSIQSLIKDGCEVKQIALTWRDRVGFVLATEDFTLRSLKFEEEITSQAQEMEAETKKQQFVADFFIMSATLRELLADLQDIFRPKKQEKKQDVRDESDYNPEGKEVMLTV